MSFETGSFNNTDDLEDVFTVLSTFVGANGWTVHSSGGMGLHASNEDCHVTLVGSTTSTIDDTFGPSGSPVAPDHRINGKLRPDATPYAAVMADSGRIVSNDWTPPYANYWLFSNADGEPPYIHLVVQKANGRFVHLSFGMVDKKGAAYTGGAFLHGVYWHWAFSGNAPQNGNNGSDLQSGSHQFFGCTNDQVNFANHNIFMGSLDANLVLHNNAFTTFPRGKIAPLMGLIRNFAQMASNNARWLGHIPHLGPNPVNGVTALMEVPVMRYNTENQRLQYLGSLPDWRYCSMIGRDEAETVNFSSDEWMIFPMKRALPWNPEPYAAKSVTSGPYGIAFKKNV